MTPSQDFKTQVSQFFLDLQDQICQGIAEADGQAVFREDLWEREGGGGGRTRLLENGRIFEKAGVNFSAVHGELPEILAKQMVTQLAAKLGQENLVAPGRDFFATGVSLVLHPQNPYVPTTHANFRYFEQGALQWFGGGADITPYYGFREDIAHFHATFKVACDRHDPSFYPTYKQWCDEYFYIKHRQQMRGAGGIFFDYLTGNRERNFAFVRDAGEAFLPAYLPIVERRKELSYGERERDFQLIRRGRYVEFNLVYDRGTMFGLQTNGRTESILMSLPTLAKWVYDYQPEPDSPEAEAWEFYQPQSWA